MRTSKSSGKPFTEASIDQIDSWSRDVFVALSGWAAMLNGRWTRWDEGYLLLEIDQPRDEPIEPVLIDTADDQIRVEFGYWEMDFPDQALDAEGAAQEMIALVSDWLSGAIRTAVFTNDAGDWCGSMLVEQGASIPPAPSEGMLSFKPSAVELRSPHKQDWKTYAV